MNSALANYPVLEVAKTSQWKTNVNNLYDRRSEKRVVLSLKMYVRRTINDITYFRTVQTTDISYNGARVICDVPLEIGAELIFSGLNGKFSAITQVRNIVCAKEDGWSIGLEFIKKTGKWLIIQ